MPRHLTIHFDGSQDNIFIRQDLCPMYIESSLSRDGTAAIALDSGSACCSKRVERSDSLTSRMMINSIVILRSFLIFIDLDVERRSMIILWQAFPGGNFTKKPRFITARWYLNALRGHYAQQHKPIRKQKVPVGHAVRFGYLETANANLCREQPDETLLSTLEQAWERMVTRRMYVTGGLGAVPGLEGFGNDYELDPEYAYAETCASLASLFWNWEMALLTKDARYSDLFEWQLYNAANVGMRQNGDTYLYNNPLEVHHGVTRQGWYVVPCCQSNLSRTFADLGRYIFSHDENDIWIHQYISNEATVNDVKIKVESNLPWSGKVKISVKPEMDKKFTLHLRKPSWTMNAENDLTASGYDPREVEEESIS